LDAAAAGCLKLMPLYRQSEARLGRRHMQEWRRRALRASALLLFTLAVCVVGLTALDSTAVPLGARLSRALWNAVNLVTTLGDFTGFDDRQKLFMIGAMFVAIIVGGYALAQLTGIMSSEAVMALRENKMVERSLEHLSQHVIVMGFGPLGQLVAQRLKAGGENVVIIEWLANLATQASDLGYLVVQAETLTDDDTLKQAGLDKAKALVVTTEDADRKVALTLMAHYLNPKLKIAVTGTNSQRGALLHRAGASEVIIAEDLIAEALVSRLVGNTKTDG
jgi:voltage-gated potassium channel